MADPDALTHEPKEQSTGLGALARYLRERPDALGTPVPELAERFGLSHALVGDVIEELKGPEPGESAREALFKATALLATQAWNRVVSVFLWATAKPMLFVFTTTLVALLIVLVVRLGSPITLQQGEEGVMAVAFRSLTGAAVLITCSLHLLCYGRHGMARYPLLAACTAFVVTTPMLLYGAVLMRTLAGIGSALSLVAGCVMLALFYAGLGVSASLIGGYLKMQQETRARYRLSRQELLERLFRLEERLDAIEEDPKGLRRHRSRLAVLRHSQSFWGFAALVGAATGLLQVIVLGTMHHVSPQLAGQGTELNFVVQLVLVPVTLACVALVGYIAGDVRCSVLAVTLAVVSSDLPRLLPWGYFGWAEVARLFSLRSLATSVPFFAFLGVLTGVGALIEDRASRERRLRRDDPAAVAAELVRIHWRLTPRPQATCVMAIDVVGSTNMKLDEDPLVVEWSFREYQRLIERVVAKMGGYILSTAGDGAVVTFNHAVAAIEAAKQIHREIARFSVRSNRLRRPFQLRIGVHSGKVSAELNEVQFNEIIDIAAHVEASAPAGGIAVTKAVASELREEPMAELKERVNGQQVFFLLNPTATA